jgi:hypothetical protein
MPKLPYRVATILALLLLGACSTQPLRLPDLASAYLQSEGRPRECAQLFAKVDSLTLEAAAMDAQAARLPGFPYLRVNRLLESFRHELQDQHKLQAWLKAMRKLDQEARSYELQNADVKEQDDMLVKLDDCAKLMLYADLQDPAQLEKIKQSAAVPDDYIKAMRILGVYPLSSLFVKTGVRRLHKKIKETYSSATEDLVTKGSLVAYAAEESITITEAEVAHILQASSANALSIPSFSKQDEERLFRYFAPVWELNQLSGEDSIGTPYWDAEGKIIIQTSEVVIYRHLSHTRVNDQILPQFNYIIWLPSRPANGAFDILAGHLDGLTWRVTVGRDGKVLMYDAMHNCGCYHMFFPKGDTVIREPGHSKNEEPVLVPQRAPLLQAGQRIHLRIASGTHYIEAVQAKSPTTEYIAYRLADYNTLRAIVTNNGERKSMFSINGIVPGTSRKERWLLWPMGIEDAGAMRQWGHHATAFVGRRHFDDADLLERYFSFH